jgi:hypothetical protein
MVRSWLRLAIATVLLAGCSTTTTATPPKTPVKATATSTPKATASRPPLIVTTGTDPVGNPANPDPSNNPNPSVTSQPLRDGHFLAFMAMKPASGLSLKIARSGGATSIAYTPDPPDVTLTLAVPDTSLPVQLAMVNVAYEVDGKPAKFGPLMFPMPTKFIEPNSPALIPVEVGTALLKGLFPADHPEISPTTLNAIVTFTDEKGFAINDATGKPLSVTIPILFE